jgi:hypothetical protein
MSAETVARPVVVVEPGVYELDDETYHLDPVPGGSLSCSGAKLLLPPSCPAIFKWQQENPPESNKNLDLGKAAHKLVLGSGPELVEVEYDSWRTKDAQEQKKAAHAAGKVPLLTEDMNTVKAMAAAIRRHPMASRLFDPERGQPEMALFWIDERTGIMRRSKLDWLPHVTGNNRMIIPDYKSAISANPERFAKAVMDHRYYMQSPWYRDAVLALKLALEARFVFVVQEKTPPYLVTVVELDPTAIRIGEIENRRAIDTYKQCRDTDTWPGYADHEVAQVFLPTYYERRFEEQL